MRTVELKEFGERLKQIRLYLGLSQNQLAKKLNANQGVISKLEQGNGSMRYFIPLLSFYSKYVYINYIFADEFHLVSTGTEDVTKSNFESFISTVLNETIKDHEKDLIEVNNKFKDKLTKVVELLNG